MRLKTYVAGRPRGFELTQKERWRGHRLSIVPLFILGLTVALVATVLVSSGFHSGAGRAPARASFEADAFQSTLFLVYGNRDICRRSIEPGYFGVSLGELSAKSSAHAVRLYFPGSYGRTLSVDDRFHHFVIKGLAFTSPVKAHEVFQSSLVVRVQGEDEGGVREITLPFQFMVDGDGKITDCVAVKKPSSERKEAWDESGFRSRAGTVL